MTDRIGSFCETHQEWSATNRCRWCEPEREPVVRFHPHVMALPPIDLDALRRAIEAAKLHQNGSKP